MRFEHWWFTTPLRLRSIFRRSRVEQELDEELQFHLDHKVEEGIALGLSPEEARRRALRAMDGLEQRKEEMRDARRVHWLTDLVDDVRYALRSLRHTPGLTAFIVATLALGIGLTAAPFSMVDALVFRPYPVPNPGNVVTLASTSRDDAFELFSYREYLDIRDLTRSYDGVIANAPLKPIGFSAVPATTPRIKGGMLVSGNYLAVLGVEPRLGRGFRPDEDQVPGRDAVVVLAPGFWRQEFGGDPNVVGRTVRLNGKEFSVIGVAPESFTGMLVFTRPDFYVPLAMASSFATDASQGFFEDRDDRTLSVKGRLKRGTTLGQAREELTQLAASFAREHPAHNRDRGATVRTQFQLRTRGDDLNWKFSVIFVVLALSVLAVACTNVAGLMLSRGLARSREIALRLAIGAGRFRLIRLLLAESLVLACLGGLAGVAVGFGAIEYLRAFSIPSELPVTIPFRMDLRVLLGCLGVSVVSALLFGLAPALQASRVDLVHGLKAADVDADGRRRLWGRNALVVTQVAMSLMLLTAAFLMARSFREVALQATGFAKDHLLMVRFDPRLVQYDAARTQRFYQLLAERARQAPGVRSAALTLNPPLGLGDFDSLSFVPDGYAMPPDREAFTALLDTVDEGYFETLEIPILRGRAFQASDAADAPRVAIVNEQLARRYWPDGDALGKTLRLDRRDGTPVEIVGIAPTLRYQDTNDLPVDFVYFPLAQRPKPRMVLLLRSHGDPLELVETVRQVVRSIDPNLPLLETRSYEDLYRYSMVEGPRVAISLVGSMGGAGLLLAIAGLYGLVAYNVSRRTREIGVRMAIGAGPRAVLGLVMGRGLALVAIGTLMGTAMGVAVEKLMDSMLFRSGGGGMDVVAYLVVVPSMLLVTLLAAYVPARRATRISPTLALRCE